MTDPTRDFSSNLATFVTNSFTGRAGESTEPMTEVVTTWQVPAEEKDDAVRYAQQIADGIVTVAVKDVFDTPAGEEKQGVVFDVMQRALARCSHQGMVIEADLDIDSAVAALLQSIEPEYPTLDGLERDLLLRGLTKVSAAFVEIASTMPVMAGLQAALPVTVRPRVTHALLREVSAKIDEIKARAAGYSTDWAAEMLDWSAQPVEGVVVAGDVETAPREDTGPAEPAEAAAPAQQRHRFADVTAYVGGRSEDRRLGAGRPLVEGESYEVEVAIRQRRTGLPHRGKRDEPIVEPGKGHDVKLWVTAAGQGVDFDNSIDWLVLPPDGDSTENAWFRFTPTRRTPARNALTNIEFNIYYGCNLIESFLVRAEVVGAYDDAEASDLGLDDPVAVFQLQQRREYRALADLKPRSLNITVRPDGDFYSFMFVFGTAAGDVTFNASSRISATVLQDRIDAVRDAWQQIVMRESYLSAVDVTRFRFADDLKNLALTGHTLWNRLFAVNGDLSRIAAWMDDNPLAAGSVIQVSMSGNADFVFPWSLVYDGAGPQPGQDFVPDVDDFWGLRYVIEQQTASRDGSAEERPRKVGAELNVAVMLNARFPHAQEQVALLQRLGDESDGRVVPSEPPIETPVDAFGALSEGRADVLYFYTHGFTRLPRAAGVGEPFERFLKFYDELPKDSAVREHYRPLAESIQAGAVDTRSSWFQVTQGRVELEQLWQIDRLASRPIVVLNMCESGQVVPSFSDSFVQFFLGRGSQCVIGTECSMAEVFASDFGATLMRHLLAGKPVGEALLAARRTFVDEHSNPLGLAYTLFGSAMAQFDSPLIPLESPAHGDG